MKRSFCFDNYFLFRKLFSIADPGSSKFFALANDKSEQFSKYFVKYLIPALISSHIPMSTISYILYIFKNGSENVDVDQLYVPFKYM